jgi:glycosyltransferase involved in cell wall biosynthesis
MEQTLGNTTHYLNLRRAQAANDSGFRWIPIEYRKSMLPWTLAAGRQARKSLLPILDEVAGVFLHTMTLAPGVMDLLGRKPFVISGDATPFAKREMRTAYGHRPQRPLAEIAKREFYRWMFKRAAGFVAWSHWARQSLVRDYGCPEDDVVVIPPGIDLDLFVPGERGRAELVLVTRDPVPEEPGVFVHGNVQANSDALRQLYATSDIFALPTRADCYSLVCMEALAAGMPVVTTRIGGIPDLVLESGTGHLIDVDDEQALTNALMSLVDDPARRRTMAQAARADAIARFGANANAQVLFDFVRSRC